MTPHIIANKKNLDIDRLRQFFETHTLEECGREFGCSPTTIKRHLRGAGIDTSIHNHSALAKGRSAAARRTYFLSDDELRRLFIDENLDTKTIAEMQNPKVHFNVVRAHVRRLGLKKSRKLVARSMSSRHIRNHGCRHPAQRPDVITKTRSSGAKVKFTDRMGRGLTFRSLYEFGYALLLENLGAEWYYEEMTVPYVDALSGKHRSYTIDFTVVRGDTVEWVEVKPNEKMIPEDKRVYASRRAEEAGVIYRGLTVEEREKSKELLFGPLSGVEFTRPKPRASASKITYYFLTESAAVEYTLTGWRGQTPRQLGENLWARTFLRRR